MTVVFAGAALVVALLAAIALDSVTNSTPPIAATWRILAAGTLPVTYPLRLSSMPP